MTFLPGAMTLIPTVMTFLSAVIMFAPTVITTLPMLGMFPAMMMTFPHYIHTRFFAKIVTFLQIVMMVAFAVMMFLVSKVMNMYKMKYMNRPT